MNGDITRSPHSLSSRYTILNEIGVGAYGTVYLGRDNNYDISNYSSHSPSSRGPFVAIKRLRVQNTDEGIPLSHVREIALLRQLDAFEHPNVIRLLDVCPGESSISNEIKLNLVFEYVDMDLEWFMKQKHDKNQQITTARIQDITKQMLAGIDFLHQHRVCHRDLKPQNILLSQENGQIKIADFGLARIYSFNMALTSVVVTLWYRPPEVLLQTSYATPVDLWSLGCIIAELFLLDPLFPGESEFDQINTIFNKLGTPPPDQWPQDAAVPYDAFQPKQGQPLAELVPRLSNLPLALDMLTNLFTFDQHLRLRAAEALNHPWLLQDTENTPPSSENS